MNDSCELSNIDCWMPDLHILELTWYRPAPIKVPSSLQPAGHLNVKTEPGSPFTKLITSSEFIFVLHVTSSTGGNLARFMSFCSARLLPPAFPAPAHTIAVIAQTGWNVLASGTLNVLASWSYSGMLLTKITVSLSFMISCLLTSLSSLTYSPLSASGKPEAWQNRSALVLLMSGEPSLGFSNAFLQIT